jgi:hypothetical protein
MLPYRMQGVCVGGVRGLAVSAGVQFIAIGSQEIRFSLQGLSDAAAVSFRMCT